MATMIKEKSKERKKNRDKQKAKKEPESFIEEDKAPQRKAKEIDNIEISAEITGCSKEKIDTKENRAQETVTTIVVNTNIENNKIKTVEVAQRTSKIRLEQETVPSAPILEEQETELCASLGPSQEVVRSKVKCLPFEEALRLFGGKEIAEVRAISEKEEAIVEAGPQSTPEHPLVDLLSTFRTSLNAVDQARIVITLKYNKEENCRESLWNIQKRTIYLTEKCRCGANVNIKANFEVATLDREKLSSCRSRLESLLQEVQESYCYRQHTALQTHYDVDEFINETLKKPKTDIREALMLVFDALRFSEGAPVLYAEALQRWASILSTALLEEENMCHLLFVLHNLFRQTRSVQWAGRVINMHVEDMSDAARLVGLLELLLTRSALESAQECTEDSEAWEEVDDCGEGSAVAEGRLRERDLLALLQALPLRELLLRLALFGRQEENPTWWGDGSGGHGVLKACCGARVTLKVLLHARERHVGYSRLREYLRKLAANTLDVLAALHLQSRSSYSKDLEEKITAELEACFTIGFNILEDEAYKLPASILSDDVVQEYCNTIIAGLHVKSIAMASLSIEVSQSCRIRVRIATQTALSRPVDRDLAKIVLDFLFQTGIHRKPACKGGCDVTARELLPQLLSVHPHIHTTAFYLLADCNQGEIDESLLEPLSLQDWRPTPNEVCGVLDDWAVRCPLLLQHLLLNLDYTPHTGVSLESQLSIGTWLCASARGSAPLGEWAWQALRALRLHRAQWRLPLCAAPPAHATPPAHAQLFHDAHALLASDWGHSVPLVCGVGAEALLRLAQARAGDALHCAGLVMRVMAQSPESVSLTPRFTEIFAAILNSGPTLVQRALGLRNYNPADMLQTLILEQMRDTEPQCRGALVSAWLHALWPPALPSAARAALDAALRRCRDWRTLDSHAAMLLQTENAKEYLTDAVRNASVAPLLCESLLRAANALERGAAQHGRLLDELARQRSAGQKIHVDNALKKVGWPTSEGELSIHRCASGALAAPPQHAAHALLWRLLLHMWLQRPRSVRPENVPPIGPLFFSGMVKSRTLVQLKKRLQETATYHHNQIDILKTKEESSPSPVKTDRVKRTSPSTDDGLFRMLTITDLTGEPISEPESAIEGDSNSDGVSGSEKERDLQHLISYHIGAEKMIREYLQWIEEGERSRANPHNADISRYISDQALDAAWRASLDSIANADPPSSPSHVRATPTPTPTLTPTVPPPHLTYYERAQATIASMEDGSQSRYKILGLPISIADLHLKDPVLLLDMVEQHLEELMTLNDQWERELTRVTQLHGTLWERLEALRVRRPLPPVRGPCPQGCGQVTAHIPEDEWCISIAAEQAFNENKRSARAELRKLAQARPHAARVTSLVQTMARCMSSLQSCVRAAQLAWEAVPRTEAYAPARDAIESMVNTIAQRWVHRDVPATCSLLARWSSGSARQRQLCGALVAPLQAPRVLWPTLYNAVLALQLTLPPHVVFSYLSKFDMKRWSDFADTSSRNEVLESIVKVGQRIGPDHKDEDLVLLEILGLHSSVVVREDEVSAHVSRCARACAASSAPPAYCAHLPSLAQHLRRLHMDQIGQLLYQLGVIWWEARTSNEKNRTLYVEYAPYFADTLYSFLKEYTAAAIRNTYEPRRVSSCSWSSLQTAWSPWLAPHPSPALAPPAHRHHNLLLARFLDAIRMIMAECRDCNELLLRDVWEWAAASTVAAGPYLQEPETRLQATALLERLGALPWSLQWFRGACVPLALQISTIPDGEIKTRFGQYMRYVGPDSWLRDVIDEQVSPVLSALLALFTSIHTLLPVETLEQACQLPWQRLPVPAVDGALEHFFAEHHNPALPYHHVPQFRVLLFACQLLVVDENPVYIGACAEKRAIAMSQWVRAATSPTLKAHVKQYSEYVLDVLTKLAPHVLQSELEALLSRALVVMCVRPADSLALPVWEQWLATCPVRVRRACAAAVGTLTTLDYFAALADVAANAIMSEKEPVKWSDVWSRWSNVSWPASALASRGRLHAAYALLHAHPSPAPAHATTAALRAVASYTDLASGEFDFPASEAAAGEEGAGGAAAGGEGEWEQERRECVQAARSLLLRWAEQRRTLLQLVSLKPSSICATLKHRALCQLALCGSASTEESVRKYEAVYDEVARCFGEDARRWARDPPATTAAARLPQLAARLHPGDEHYFAHELDLSLDD